MEINSIKSLQKVAGPDGNITAKDLKQIDTDNDGKISNDEAKTAEIDLKDLDTINKEYTAHQSEPSKVIFSQNELEAKKQQQFVKTNFKEIDSDNDGFLSKGELSKAAENGKFSDDDKTIISKLRDNIGNIEEYSNDEWFDENDGITLKDMDVMVNAKVADGKNRQRSDNSLMANEVNNFVKANFKTLDKDGDGFLSKGELDKAIYDKSITGKDAAMVAALRDTISNIEDFGNDEWFWENDGITLNDMDKFVKRAETNPDDIVMRGILGSYIQANQRIEAANRKLYADEADPIKSIRLDHMAQGDIGDCFFLSAVASLVDQNPKAIMDMITENPVKDGEEKTYTVKFPGADRAVTVTGPSDGEIAAYATSGPDGIWLNVLEKAYATLRNESAPTYHHANPREAIDGGDFQDSAIKLLTGHTVDTDFMPLSSKDSMRKKLMDALPEKGDKRMVTASTFMDGDEDKNMIPNHVFTVLAYDPKTDTVTVRNPWGPGSDARGIKFPDPNSDGTFTLTMDEFDEYFNILAFEEKKPIENYDHLEERYWYKLS